MYDIRRNIIRRYVTVLVLAVWFGAAVGCDRPPVNEQQEAEAALERADSVQADRFSPELFQEAQDVMAVALRSMDADNYDEARALFDTVRVKAATAVIEANSARTSLREEADSLLTEAEELVNHLSEQAERLRGAHERDQIESDLLVVRSSLESARDRLAEGDVQQAHTLASDAHVKADSLRGVLMGDTSATHGT